jgi:O-antigen/teichoic acid export membrane protein
LTRHLEFRVQAIASGVSNLSGAALAIVLAIRGAGVWSLVAQILLTTLLNVVMIWWLHSWRPTATFSYQSFRKLFQFGGFMLASAVVDTIATRLYSLLIGRLYSSHDLGLYSRSISTRDSSQTILSTVFSRVALPVLARHGSDPAALLKRLKSANQLTMAINLPSMIGLSMVANLAMPTLFGKQWSQAGPVLQILCLGGALFPMQVSNLQVLMAQGHSGKMFRIGTMKNGILIASTLIASHWGILAIAWAAVFSALASFLINTHYSRILIGYGAIKQLRDLSPYVLLTAGMVLIVSLIDHALSWMTPGKLLLAEVVGGASFYLSIALALRMPAVGFAIHVLRSLRSK